MKRDDDGAEANGRVGIQPTYEELKRDDDGAEANGRVGIQPTYEELKPEVRVGDEETLKKYPAYL